MANKVLTDDIQTGRNVYVDQDRILKDEEYRARIKKYVDEGYSPVAVDPHDAFDMLCGAGSDGPIS